MNRRSTLIVLLVCLSALLGCGEDSTDPGEKDNDPVSPYSGIFYIEAELAGNDCAAPAPPSTMTTVLVEGDSIWFGGFPGIWDESSLTGTGDTPEYTVPVTPPECYSYYKVIYEITYVTADSFSGVYGSDFRKDPGCLNPDPCSFRYNITGSR